VDLPAVAAAALAPASGVVVDVGCGPGVYGARLAGLRPDLRVAGVDLSAGMRPAVVADAVRLPFATGAAGAALAMHMLYHVPDVPAAVAELRRVTAPGGVVVVSTNGRDDKPELGRLVRDVAAGPGGAGAPFVSPSEAFTAEDGDVLAQRFGDVRRQVFDRVVEVPEAAGGRVRRQPAGVVRGGAAARAGLGGVRGGGPRAGGRARGGGGGLPGVDARGRLHVPVSDGGELPP
jgi:SAM-dependent methyltransferase